MPIKLSYQLEHDTCLFSLQGSRCCSNYAPGRKKLSKNFFPTQRATIKKKSTKAKVCQTLTEIDHMRDRKNYLKVLAQWANDLSLQGTVIFCNSTKRILLILASSDPVNGSNYFKEFHVKLRTTNVDVDSAGRPCKERMATVLSPSIKINRKNVFKEFSVVQIPNKDAIDLETFFHQLSLEDVYKNYFKRS